MTDKSLKDKAISIKGKAYVLVADRVVYFNENYPKGSIITSYELLNDMFIVKATITTGGQTVTGHSQAIIGDGMVNKTAALENAETSAVGRALALLGIGVIDSIASVDEINKAQGSNGERKFASPKSIDWIRKEAGRVAKLDNNDEIDNWVEAQLTLKPARIPQAKVKAAVDKIRDLEKEFQDLEKEANDKPLPEDLDISEEDVAKVQRGEIDY